MKAFMFAVPVALSFGFAPSAWAHAHLDSATPAADAVLTASPEEILLIFTEDLELKLSALTLSGPQGAAVAVSAPEHEAGDPRSLRVTTPKLAPGVYKVEWTAVSVDTHSTKGSFSFTLD